MEQKKFLETYEAPVVEIVEVQVERGFADSAPDLNGKPNDWDF